jgi:hypothetical protein
MGTDTTTVSPATLRAEMVAKWSVSEVFRGLIKQRRPGWYGRGR